MANAIVGSAEIVVVATLIGLPIGFFAGVYLAEFGGKTFAFLVRYMADLLNGIPSIVIGIFAWTVMVVPLHHFSALAGSLALSLMLIPITARSTEQFLLEVPRSHARRLAGAGRQQMAHHRQRDRARRAQGHHDRHDSRRRAHLRRNRAAAVHQPEQPVLEHRALRAHGLASGHDLYLRPFRLTTTGTGRPGPPDWSCWLSYCWPILLARMVISRGVSLPR